MRRAVRWPPAISRDSTARRAAVTVGRAVLRVGAACMRVPLKRGEARKVRCVVGARTGRHLAVQAVRTRSQLGVTRA
ncbi:hypothetical protein Sm713_37190 [Streptomyces sp. TS71-3]|nr:hypothetical protein Sm713_37190 [Streptomyces sp. TS71-3]